jgi:hypothetical protein
MPERKSSNQKRTGICCRISHQTLITLSKLPNCGYSLHHVCGGSQPRHDGANANMGIMVASTQGPAIPRMVGIQ